MGKWFILLLHGFASSANSGKAQFFREKLEGFAEADFCAFDFNPTPADFEYMTITGMINRLRQFLFGRQHERVLMIGSSMGALVGLNYAHRFGGVEHMLLLAPALSYLGHSETSVFHFGFNSEIPLREDFSIDGELYRESVPPPAPMLIVHGRYDNVIPITNSRRYAAKYSDQVELLEVESDHRLNDQLDIIWGHLRELMTR